MTNYSEVHKPTSGKYLSALIQCVLIMRHGHRQRNAREELDRGEQVLVFLFEQGVTYPIRFGLS